MYVILRFSYLFDGIKTLSTFVCVEHSSPNAVFDHCCCSSFKIKSSSNGAQTPSSSRNELSGQNKGAGTLIVKRRRRAPGWEAGVEAAEGSGGWPMWGGRPGDVFLRWKTARECLIDSHRDSRGFTDWLPPGRRHPPRRAGQVRPKHWRVNARRQKVQSREDGRGKRDRLALLAACQRAPTPRPLD